MGSVSEGECEGQASEALESECRGYGEAGIGFDFSMLKVNS